MVDYTYTFVLKFAGQGFRFNCNSPRFYTIRLMKIRIENTKTLIKLKSLKNIIVM